MPCYDHSKRKIFDSHMLSQQLLSLCTSAEVVLLTEKISFLCAADGPLVLSFSHLETVNCFPCGLSFSSKNTPTNSSKIDLFLLTGHWKPK